METIDFAHLEITSKPSDVDENNFVSLWNVAESTVSGNAIRT